MTLTSSSTLASPAERTSRARDGARATRAGVLGWAIVVGLVVAQWGMFRQFAQREITRSYPASGDQLIYLDQAYRTYERILDHGILPGLADGAGLTSQSLPLRETGATFHLQAALLFLTTGASRLAALSLNFLYWASLQIALVATVRWLTGRWTVALLALGLLLTTATAFGPAGGLFDFRIDFAAACLFGCFLCLVVRSGMFADRRWAAAAGLCGAALGTMRFITLVYLGGALAVFAAILVVQWFRRWHDLPGQQLIQRRLGGLFLAGAVIALVAAPVLWHHRHVIYGYYVVGHMEGAEPAFRARAAGTTTVRSNLAYAPASLLRDHAGYPFLLVGALVLAIAWMTRMLTNRPGTSHVTDRSDVPLTAGFFGACIAVPLLAQTLDRAKSPVVADIMIPPLVWLVTIGVIRLGGFGRGHRARRITNLGLGLSALLAIGFAIDRQAAGYCRRTWVSHHPAEVQRIQGMYDGMADACQAMGWSAPSVISDQLLDFLDPSNLPVRAYERAGTLLNVRIPLDGIYAHRTADVRHALQQADFVILSRAAEGEPPESASPFPYDRQMQAMHPELQDWCRANLIELQDFALDRPLNRRVTLFVRPALNVQATPDGWITSQGLEVAALAPVLRSRPTIVLSGHCDIKPLGGVPKATAEITVPDGTISRAPATMNWSDYAYRIEVRLAPERLPAGGVVRVRLTFDRFFVPGHIGTSADARELVMQAPDEGHVQ